MAHLGSMWIPWQPMHSFSMDHITSPDARTTCRPCVCVASSHDVTTYDWFIRTPRSHSLSASTLKVQRLYSEKVRPTHIPQSYFLKLALGYHASNFTTWQKRVLCCVFLSWGKTYPSTLRKTHLGCMWLPYTPFPRILLTSPHARTTCRPCVCVASSRYVTTYDWFVRKEPRSNAHSAPTLNV